MKDISHFNNISDYLPILNGAIIADIIIILALYYTPFINSVFLKKWYETYRLSAVIADVLILVIGMILARFFYYMIFDDYSLFKFTGLTVVIQVIHDILFYLFFMIVPRNMNKSLDIFKDYAKEVSYKAIFGDSFMMILSVLVASYLASFNINTNIIVLIVSVYLIPYVINIK